MGSEPRLHRALLLVAALGVGAHCTPAESPSGETRGAPETASARVPSRAPAVLEAGPDVVVPDAGTEAGAPEHRVVDEKKLAELVADAEARESDALVIVQDGHVLGQWLFGKPLGPIQTMSITKSVLSLAVGTLVDAGKLKPEQAVATWYPEWGTDDHRAVTVDHLLTHTSGLEEGDSTLPIYQSRDFVKQALRTQLVHPPGTHYEYGNRAANLLAGVVAKAAGMPTERYVAKVLFEPMGIRQYWWSKDRAGNAHGMAGLHLLPRDLAKLGELVLSKGRWDGRQLVSSEWIERSTTVLAPVQPDSRRLGRLWWLVPEWVERTVDDQIVDEWKTAGVDPGFLAKTAPLHGRKFRRLGELLDELERIFGDPSLKEWTETTTKKKLPDLSYGFGPVVGCYSAGTLGQFLVVLPRDGLVAVRMRRAPKDGKRRDDPKPAFLEFVERVQALTTP